MYEKTIKNEYLGLSKVVRAKTQYELMIKVNNQLQTWEKREERERKRQRIQDMKEQAKVKTDQALEEIEQYKNILNHTLSVDDKVEWDELYDKQKFKDFSFREEPQFEKFKIKHAVPKENKFLEAIIPSLKKKRIKLLSEAEADFNNSVEQYKREKEEALKLYNEEKEEFLQKQSEYNKSVDKFKQLFESGDPDAIEKYIRLVLEHSVYPDAVPKEFEVQYDNNSEIAIVDYSLPNPNDIPKIIEYKFVQTRNKMTTKEMNKRDFNKFYEQIILQITLRTIHELFESVYNNKLSSIVFNGWVEGIDPATGKDFNSCIISVQASKDQFEELQLERVDVKECFKSLKGLSAGPLNQLAPVKPIMQINTKDKRFIESKEVLADVNSVPNLAQMDWEDFEHLVRELFGKIFKKEGGEVKVTRASRDGGVDAIAFDPDPIRGGKYVIQAKRYNNVVPVSAVRDLYGTMINEGAVKGILVTTSYYGNDSREFVKDKPISLIDGANLVHLFQEHGHNVRIELNKKQ